ncbi:helix-turn-helix domain-containing protein [Nonomuraea montanisoli]|uniref:helix-turn-helix domain-containing protein n=1 Tax=Nonomuraea montanisoli TaxID=2741721 RepID=UPI002E2B2D37|nr:helix-turn-helix transcriptional regulator [Nonomuraea montanisoli]
MSRRRSPSASISQQQKARFQEGQMGDREEWQQLRDRRMAEPGAAEAYEAARLAHELGKTVRAMRENRGWTQSDLAREAGMTQSAVARFEAGGSCPPCRSWDGWRVRWTRPWMSG